MTGAAIAVIVPVLGRPQNAGPLAESLFASRNETDLQLWFVASKDDEAQVTACHEALDAARPNSAGGVFVAPWPKGMRGDFARKSNLGLWLSTTPFVLCGADDLRFRDHWADIAISTLEQEDTGFCGTNDLANPKVKAGQHATHPVVRRSYALECGTIDTPGLIYSETYWHQWVDNEATETAQARGCFSFAADSIVEHLHPIWRSAPDDDTYRHGQLHGDDDRRLFRERRPLWGGRH